MTWSPTSVWSPAALSAPALLRVGSVPGELGGRLGAGSLGLVNLVRKTKMCTSAPGCFWDALHGRRPAFPGNIRPLDPLFHPRVADSQRSLPRQLGTVPAPPDPTAPRGSSGSLGLSLRVRPFSGSPPRFRISSWKSKAIKFALAGARARSGWLGRQAPDPMDIYNAAARLKTTEISAQEVVLEDKKLLLWCLDARASAGCPLSPMSLYCVPWGSAGPFLLVCWVLFCGRGDCPCSGGEWGHRGKP